MQSLILTLALLAGVIGAIGAGLTDGGTPQPPKQQLQDGGTPQPPKP